MMRITATAALLLLVSLAVAAAAAANNTSDRWEKDMNTRRIFTEWKAEHGRTDDAPLSEEEEKERAYAWFKYRLSFIDQRLQDNGYSVFRWESGRNEEETRQLFAEWKVQSGMTYTTAAEEERRYAIFKGRLRDTDRHNAGYAVGAHRYAQGVHLFGDRTDEELKSMCGLRPLTAEQRAEMQDLVF